MTITTEQLDELEARAKAAQHAIAMGRPLRCVLDEYVEAINPDVVLHLAAIARAALANADVLRSFARRSGAAYATSASAIEDVLAALDAALEARPIPA